jgi:oligopeptide transport system permease protein
VPRLILEKLLFAIATLLIIATVTFFLMHHIPGNPFMDERSLPEEVMNALQRHYGLDLPVWKQYLTYLNKLLHLDLGPSLQYEGRNVTAIIRDSFPISLLLGFEALFLATSLGFFLASLAAFKYLQKQDRLILLYAVLALSVPSFVSAGFLQYALSIKIDLFPVARWGTFMHTVLPSLSLMFLPSAFITRLLRSSMIETLEQDYILTAKAKGLSPLRIAIVHVLPNSLLPVMAYLGPLSAAILTGSFAIEKIFGIPGLGAWFVLSISSRDYPLIMGLTLFYSCLVVFFSYVIDITYLLLNPRLRHRKEDLSYE